MMMMMILGADGHQSQGLVHARQTLHRAVSPALLPGPGTVLCLPVSLTVICSGGFLVNLGQRLRGGSSPHCPAACSSSRDHEVSPSARGTRRRRGPFITAGRGAQTMRGAAGPAPARLPVQRRRC